MANLKSHQAETTPPFGAEDLNFTLRGENDKFKKESDFKPHKPQNLTRPQGIKPPPARRTN